MGGGIAELVIGHVDLGVDVDGLEVDAEAVEVLIGVGELGAEEADGPRDLYPEHEQGQGGKGAVDGVIAGHPDLRVDVEQLEEVHGSACEDAWDDGARPLDLRIGHIDEEQHEEQRHEQEGGHVEQQANGRGQQRETFHCIGDGGHEDGESHRHEDDDRADEEHGEVVDERPHEGTGIADTPDLVEGLLDIVDQHEHGVEHEEQSDAEEHAALGVDEVAIDEVDDEVGHLWLGGHHLAKPDLDVLVVAEPTGDGEDDGEDGDHRKERGVGEGGCLSRHPLLGEETDGQIHDPVNLLQMLLYHGQSP